MDVAKGSWSESKRAELKAARKARSWAAKRAALTASAKAAPKAELTAGVKAGK